MEKCQHMCVMQKEIIVSMEKCLYFLRKTVLRAAPNQWASYTSDQRLHDICSLRAHVQKTLLIHESLRRVFLEEQWGGVAASENITITVVDEADGTRDVPINGKFYIYITGSTDYPTNNSNI